MKNLIHFFAISSIVLLGASLEAAIDVQVNQTRTQTPIQSVPQDAIHQTVPNGAIHQTSPNGAIHQTYHSAPVKGVDLPNARGATAITSTTSTTAFVSDQDLAKEIKQAIKDDRIFSTDSKIKIQVTVFNGKVTLSGDVKNEEEKARAEILATQINKLKGVVNNLRVVK